MKQMKTQSSSQAKHTPGPWHIQRQGKDGNNGRFMFAIQSEDGREIVDDRIHVLGRTYFELEANAKLIAAAPELLAACQAVLDWAATPGPHAGNPYCHEFVKLATSAIAKPTAS